LAGTGERTDRPLIAVAILASFVAFLDGSVVNLALPAISRASNADAATRIDPAW